VHVSFGVNYTEKSRKSITRPDSEWFDANSRVCSARLERADLQTQSCRSKGGDSLAAVIVVELQAPLLSACVSGRWSKPKLYANRLEKS